MDHRCRIGNAPSLFLPVTQDFYDTNKWTLLIIIALASFAVWLYRSLRQSVFMISRSQAVIGLGSITIAALASLAFASTNKVEALLSPFGPATFLALTLLVAFLPTVFDSKWTNRLFWLLQISITFIALIAIYQFFGMGKVMFPKLTYLSDPLWTPTGSTIASLSLFVIFLPIFIAHTYTAWKTNNEMHLSFLALMSLAVCTGLVITVWQLVPRINGTLLPLNTGWSMMLEVLKNPKHAIVGVGAENFLAAFSAGRPQIMNISPLWSIRFTTNANMLFHLITIYGLLGAAASFLFGKSLILSKRGVMPLSLLLGLMSFLLTPPNVTVLITITILLILAGDHAKPLTIKVPRSIVPRTVITAVLCIVIGTGLYFTGRTYAAELTFYQSLVLSQENNGTATYTTQMNALKLNPNLTRFHITFSQTNIALAASLASTISTSQASKMSADELNKDRNLVAQLIQQSISEAKIAVKLNPSNVLGWENLARIYQQLINVAQGSADWSVASFQQAILLDPTNPSLHLELGSVYVKTNKYANAITEFERAAALKPNYANAYYNLSNAYHLNNDITQSISAMQQAEVYVDKTSNDYEIVSEQLNALEKDATGSSTIPTTKARSPASSPRAVPSLMP